MTLDPMNFGADWRHSFRQAHIFANLTESEAERLLLMVEHASFDEGEALFCEGDPRARLMLIRRGRIRLTRSDVLGVQQQVAMMVRGDLLGEGMLINESIHSTTATAIAPSPPNPHTLGAV